MKCNHIGWSFDFMHLFTYTYKQSTSHPYKLFCLRIPFFNNSLWRELLRPSYPPLTRWFLLLYSYEFRV